MIFIKLAAKQKLDQLMLTIVTHFTLKFRSDSKPDQVKLFMDRSSGDLIQYQSSLGRHIRNEFKLWENELLKQQGIHPDDFSQSCIEAIHKEANATLRSFFKMQ